MDTCLTWADRVIEVSKTQRQLCIEFVQEFALLISDEGIEIPETGRVRLRSILKDKLLESNDKKDVAKFFKKIDKANGYLYLSYIGAYRLGEVLFEVRSKCTEEEQKKVVEWLESSAFSLSRCRSVIHSSLTIQQRYDRLLGFIEGTIVRRGQPLPEEVKARRNAFSFASRICKLDTFDGFKDSPIGKKARKNLTMVQWDMGRSEIQTLVSDLQAKIEEVKNDWMTSSN